MGLFGFIGSCVSSACSFVGSAISSVGSSICSMASGIITSLGAKIKDSGGILNCLGSVGKFLGNILTNIFDFDIDEDPTQLGAKSMKSDKNLDDFDGDTKKYLKHLKEEVELDEEEIEKMSDDKKIGYAALGTALETKALSENIGDFEINPKSIYTIFKLLNLNNISENTFVSLLKGMKEIGINSFDDITDYLEGKSNENNLKIYDELSKILEEDADEKIFELKKELRSE